MPAPGICEHIMPPKRNNRVTQSIYQSDVSSQFAQISDGRHRELQTRRNMLRLRRADIVKAIAEADAMMKRGNTPGLGMVKRSKTEELHNIDRELQRIQSQIDSIFSSGGMFIQKAHQLEEIAKRKDTRGGLSFDSDNQRRGLQIESVGIEGLNVVQHAGDTSMQRKILVSRPSASKMTALAQTMHRLLGSKAIASGNDIDVMAMRLQGLDTMLCPQCGSSRILNAPSSNLECPVCGLVEFHEDVGINAFPHGTDYEGTGGYRRLARLHDILDDVCGIGNVSLSAEDKEWAKTYIKNRWSESINLIELDDIKMILKKTNRQDLVPCAVELLYYVKDLPLPNITKEKRALLTHVFMACERTFLQIRNELGRNNFTYNPALRYICILLGFDDLVGLFPPLKTETKRKDAAKDIAVIAKRNRWECFDEHVTTGFVAKKAK